ncbi:hypothetical protein VPH35_109049 [Triticum aestivum]
MVPQTATPPHLPTPVQHTHHCARPPWRRRPGSSVPAVVAEAPEAVVGAGGARWELMGAWEYYDYRRAIYDDITDKAILVDATGIILAPTESMAQVGLRPSPIYRSSNSCSSVCSTRFCWPFPWLTEACMFSMRCTR